MTDCGTCDLERGILCIDCYLTVDDEQLPPTYAEYFAWAAWYPAHHKRRTWASVALATLLTFACLLVAAPATEADERAREQLSVLREKRDAFNAAVERLEEARRCAESGPFTDFAAALKRARQGAAADTCLALSRG
jgi:hypothetical protein